jgi:F-type H+-transporting ATPase subunit gamma
MNAVMTGLAASVGGSDQAPRLLAGTGQDRVHLLIVMTAERGLCGGFNSSIARLARVHAQRLLGQGAVDPDEVESDEDLLAEAEAEPASRLNG